MKVPDSLRTLIEELAKLPSIGQKSAQRLSYSILKRDQAQKRRTCISNIQSG